MITLKQFQRISEIHANEELTEYYKIISAVAVAKNIPFDEVCKMPYERVRELHSKIETKFNNLQNVAYNSIIRAGGIYYQMETDFSKLSAGQLIELLNYDVSNDREIVRQMPAILATLSRRCRFYKWRPETYNAQTHSVRARHFEGVDIQIITAYMSFFLVFLQVLLENTRNALAAEMRTIMDKA